MILPSVVRVFFAIDPPDNIKASMSAYIDSLKDLSKTNKIRWTRTENLHITLQFLAEVQGEHVDLIISKVQAELAAAVSHLTINLRSLYLFPDPHRPRVLVVDVAPQAALAQLSAMIGRGIEAAGYKIEARAFRGHMTIGRFKTSQKTVLNFLSDAKAPDVGEIEIHEVVLFQSESHPEGSRYIPLKRIPLQVA